MTTHRVALDLRGALQAPSVCSACGSPLSAVFDGETTCFRCDECRRCWAVEIGFVSTVRDGGSLPPPRRSAGTVESEGEAPCG
jgi:hypothetical protein